MMASRVTTLEAGHGVCWGREVVFWSSQDFMDTIIRRAEQAGGVRVPKRSKLWGTRRVYEFIKVRGCATRYPIEPRRTPGCCAYFARPSALHGYRTRHYTVARPAVIAPDLVKRDFDVICPNKVWVTDISVPQQAA